MFLANDAYIGELILRLGLVVSIYSRWSNLQVLVSRQSCNYCVTLCWRVNNAHYLFLFYHSSNLYPGIKGKFKCTNKGGSTLSGGQSPALDFQPPQRFYGSLSARHVQSWLTGKMKTSQDRT